MNQRQWIPMEESTIPKKRVIGRMWAVVVGASTVLFAVIGFLVGWVVPATIVGLVLSLGFVRTVARTAESSVLADSGSREASTAEHARLFNVVDGLCVVSGDQRPSLRVVASDYPVAMAVGQPDAPGAIIVSTGFCASMERVEIEAVMAHLLWRIRTGEVALTTFVISLVRWMSRFGLGSVGRSMARRALDERVLLWADIAACQATRYPPALVSALEKSQSDASVRGVTMPTSLWFACPDETSGDTVGAGGFSSLGIHPPSLAERIAVLKEI